jgi:2-keto-4-pentenoate hydratase
MIETLIEARTSHRAVAPPSAREPLGLDRAYEIQDALRAALAKRGERVIGWKAGFTGKTSQQMFGVDHPVCAFLLASGVYSTGAAVPLSRFVGLVVEVEIAFVMARDLAGPGVTPVAAGLAVEGAMPALELVDFRYSGKPTAADVVADGVYANAVVLGQPLTRTAGLDLALEGVVYEQNGQIAATNTAAEVLGHPFNSLAWIANHLGARGQGLKTGDLVMSGSISSLLRPAAGDSVSARFTRLGSVSARFVQA